MQSVVNALVIHDEQGLAEAAKIRIGIKSVIKEVKERMEAPIKVAYQAYKNIKAEQEKTFGEFLASCEAASRAVDGKVIDYNREIEKVRQEAEAREAAKVERGSIKVETAARHLEEVPEAQRHISTEKGSITIVKLKKFKVVDLSKLPIAYHLANEPEIRRAMNAGTELPGVEYWVEDSVSGR